MSRTKSVTCRNFRAKQKGIGFPETKAGGDLCFGTSRTRHLPPVVPSTVHEIVTRFRWESEVSPVLSLVSFSWIKRLKHRIDG
jgi:hypothetical protein